MSDDADYAARRDAAEAKHAAERTESERTWPQRQAEMRQAASDTGLSILGALRDSLTSSSRLGDLLGKPQTTAPSVAAAPQAIPPRPAPAPRGGSSMGALETADLLDQAADHLEDAHYGTQIDLQDIPAYGMLLGIKDDLGTLVKSASESWEKDWDGDAGLYGAERSLSDAGAALSQAAAGEDSPGIAEVQAFEEAATKTAENARAAMDGFESARQVLVEHLAAASDQVDILIELARRTVANLADTSTESANAAERAAEIAEKLRNAVA